MFSLLTRKKRFGDPWIGHPHLNGRYGLHRRRMQLADGLCRFRRLPFRSRSSVLDGDVLARLARDGYVEIRDFLSVDVYEALSLEVEQALAEASSRRPLGRNRRPGYQSKRPFQGGASIVSMGVRSIAFFQLMPPPCPRRRASATTPSSVLYRAL